MIQNLNGFGYLSNNVYNVTPRKLVSKNVGELNRGADLRTNFDINFKGMSEGSQYKTVFDYMSAKIIDKGERKFPIDNSAISATKIKDAIAGLFKMNRVFGPYKESNPSKIGWKAYIPQDVRVYCTDKVNEARAARLKQWQSFLEYPELNKDISDYRSLQKDIKDDSLRFVIWDAVNSDLQQNNRHIPVPFDIKALDETVRYFKNIEPIFRRLSCNKKDVFLRTYTHRLRDNLLMEKGLSNNESVWVRIPSVKRDSVHKEQNIAELEILSNENWCTRSSVDKAEAALQDGDFYVYLERDKDELWQPTIGMASSRGKIDQIQGAVNNNLIPIGQLENIKEFIKKNGLFCNSGVKDEGPKAMQQILIAEKLAAYDESTGKTLEKAIKDKDGVSVLKMLGNKVETNQDGTYKIGTYKPQLLIKPQSGIVVPYSFMGIDEDKLLSNVEVINGDLILYNKNPLFSSYITKFPEKLKFVSGKILCSKEQYSMFGDDMLRVVPNKSQIIVY